VHTAARRSGGGGREIVPPDGAPQSKPCARRLRSTGQGSTRAWRRTHSAPERAAHLAGAREAPRGIQETSCRMGPALWTEIVETFHVGDAHVHELPDTCGSSVRPIRRGRDHTRNWKREEAEAAIARPETRAVDCDAGARVNGYLAAAQTTESRGPDCFFFKLLL